MPHVSNCGKSEEISDKVNVYFKRINCLKEKYVVKLVFTKFVSCKEQMF